MLPCKMVEKIFNVCVIDVICRFKLTESKQDDFGMFTEVADGVLSC
jgi:hypothetical protein